MGAISVVLGYKIRATKTNACGLPLQGEANRVVTDAFVKVGLSPEMKAAVDLEQSTADGNVSVANRTPPKLKWWNISLELAGYDPDLVALLAQYPKILDYDDKPIGFTDTPDIDPNSGVMIEVWAGGSDEDDCDIPTSDAIFSAPGTGVRYGYLAFNSKEWVSGDLSVAAEVSPVTFNGITMRASNWGRGPYNVAGTDSDGTPGRLLIPVDKKRHITFFRTPVPPPPSTNGAVALAVQSVFSGNYFGGSSLDVAPDQVDTITRTLTFTGTPTAGSAQVLFNGKPFSVVFNSTAAQAKTAIVAADDGYDASDIGTSGGSLPVTPIVFTLPLGTTLEKGTNSLTGGTTPDFSIA